MTLDNTKSRVGNETHDTKSSATTSELHSVFTSVFRPNANNDAVPALFVRLSGNNMRNQETLANMDLATENHRDQDQSLETPQRNPDICTIIFVNADRQLEEDRGPSGSDFFHQEGLLTHQDLDQFKTFCLNFQLTNDPDLTSKELFNDWMDRPRATSQYRAFLH